ncbi:MAG: hypothetical protein V1839_00280 [archaeon]
MRRLFGFAVIAAVVIFAVIFVSLLTPVEKPTNSESCTSDSDCAAAQCCHPTSAVNKAYAPDCNDVACTMECSPGTLDCGQGDIKCLEGKCQAVMT